MRFDIGSVVFIAKEIEALVTSIRIDENNHVVYRCSWFSGTEHKTDWFEECELNSRKKPVQLRIGFGEADERSKRTSKSS